MKYYWLYKTPEGFSDIAMCGDDAALTGLWFCGARDVRLRNGDCEMRETPVFRETCRWLDEYFAGRRDPGFTPNLRIDGLTAFRAEVIEELKRIPFGATVSYGDIAKAISKKHGGAKVSARAVGGAVGWNPIGIIIPCHRVIGADNDLTGYGGGLGNKISLLAHEGSDLFDVRLSAPKDRKDVIAGKFLRQCIQAVNRAAARHGLGRARCEEGDGTKILLDAIADGSSEFTAPFIFDECSDDDAKLLLESFIEYRSLYQYDLAFQLARLLARRGALVKGRMGRILAKTDWGSYGANGLLLAYLASRKGSGPLICRLLDVVGEDNRDGIFLACWHSVGKRVHECLRRKFEEWIAADASWGGGTGEAWWLGAFLAKWTVERTFAYDQLQTLTQWHFERQMPIIL